MLTKFQEELLEALGVYEELYQNEVDETKKVKYKEEVERLSRKLEIALLNNMK